MALTEQQQPGGISRRRMVGYLIAGPVLITAARYTGPATAEANIPTVNVTTATTCRTCCATPRARRWV